MIKNKGRAKGKLPFSKYFQELKEGENVAIVRESSIQANFPSRLQGRTGIVENKRGRSYIIKINDQAKEKRFLISPSHLRRIKN